MTLWQYQIRNVQGPESKRRRAALAADFRFPDVVSEHFWQVVEGKRERRRGMNIDL